LLNGLWTAWIVVGTVLEEADLEAELGETYRAYRRSVPMLLPWPRPSGGAGEATELEPTQAPHERGTRGEGYVVAQLGLLALVFFGSRGWRGAPAWPDGAARVASIGGIALLAAGIALALTGIVSLGRNLTAVPRPKPGATLVERGPYRFVRHPMYAGAVLASFGWALVSHGWLTLVYAGLILAFFDLKARREERWLGLELPGYAGYAKRVRRLIPFVY
jgi:protein-S-isoprenylcysteine O-methyltransferase Ste14